MSSNWIGAKRLDWRDRWSRVGTGRVGGRFDVWQGLHMHMHYERGCKSWRIAASGSKTAAAREFLWCCNKSSASRPI
jgi:hypothetical protein